MKKYLSTENPLWTSFLVKTDTGHTDYGSRILDNRIRRWIVRDPLYKKYPFLSPYSYVGNSPLRITDIKGEDIHILFYTTGNKKTEDAMFKAAALTRKYDIEHNPSFDPTKDKVVVMAVSDISDVIKQTQSTVKKLSPTYGQTSEFGIWSHGALDGPVGGSETSKYRLDDLNGSNQMSLKGWSSIDFNWKKGDATAGFYGCRTGVGGNESFASKVSGLPNFKGVNVMGQSNYSYPSLFTNYKNNSGKNSVDAFSLYQPNYILGKEPSKLDNFTGQTIIYQDGDKVSKTYMISSPKYSSGNVAEPMTESTNGQQTGTTYQPGNKK